MHHCIHLLLYYAYRSIHYGSKVIILIDSIILLHDSLWSKTYHIQVCGLMNGHNQIRYTRYRYLYAWMNLPICTHTLFFPIFLGYHRLAASCYQSPLMMLFLR